MANVSLRDLLDAGVHFGHQTRRWNPRMRPYIYGAKNGVHIIDLQKTARALIDACRFVNGVTASGAPVLFVGTKRAAQEIVAAEATRAGMFYVNNRWLGGMMTNFKTIKQSIDRLNKLERARDEGRFQVLSKKEALQLTREIAKMNKSLGGIKQLKGIPGAIFVVDPKKEHIAVSEARKLRIPIVALCDTNCDPEGISHVIPGNDDALKSIQLFTAAIADACIEGAAAGRSASDAAVASTTDVDIDVVHRARSSSEEPDASAAPPAPPAPVEDDEDGDAEGAPA